MQRGKFSACVAESERLCVAPYCKPRTAVLRMRDGTTPETVEAAGSAFVSLAPPPSAAPSPDEGPTYPGPGVVLLGCEGCGVPELSRSLAGSHLVQLAATEAGEPSWRSRQVNFFDHEARYLLGEQWYMRRWPIRRGQRAVGMDGSGSYLQSPEAAARLAARLSPATTSLLVLLRDPLTRAVRRWHDLQRRSDYLHGASFEAKMYSEVKELSRCFEAERGSELSSSVWSRCVAAVCGLRSCAAGGGVYAPQLAAWRHEARAFRFVTLPEDALLARPEQALQHILRALPTAAAGSAMPAAAAGRRLAASDESGFSDLRCLGSELAAEAGDMGSAE